jgi:beta-1,4-mannosyltransferase
MCEHWTACSFYPKTTFGGNSGSGVDVWKGRKVDPGSVTHGRKQFARSHTPSHRRIACLSVAPWNPYLRLLYGHLAAHGFELVEHPRFSLMWLWRARSSVGFLHFHWPESYYRYGRGPARLRRLLSWVKLVVFAARLSAARTLGYRLVWTIHQVFPHESSDRALDRRAARLLAQACHLLIAHDRCTASEARSQLAISSKIAVVPHGSYIGVYPEGLPREEARRALGVPQESFVFLCFGELRAYKEIDVLLEAFSLLSLPKARLVVAGNPKIGGVASAVRAASADNPRVISLLEFVPEGQVAELFHASDAAVLPRGDAGTSGSLVLALSLGLPVVATDVPTVRELTRDGEAGWLFRPHDLSSLRTSLERASADPSEARARGRCAFEIAKELDWTGIAEKLAELLDQTMGEERRCPESQ